MDEKFFNRVEKKYIIDKEQQSYLQKIFETHLQKSRYFESEVYNVYFDTDNYDLIIQSIDHPLFKGKLRARSYGGFDKVFLEIKTKILGEAYRYDYLIDEDADADNNVGYKRRVLITHKDFNELVKGKTTTQVLAKRNIEEKTDLQIAKEIDYLISYYNLRPKILLYYKRKSYEDESGLRITFDTNLKYRNTKLKFSKNPKDKFLFSDEKNIIMEIKAGNAMPIWLSRLLSAEHIYPEQFSKIGKIYEQLRKENYVQ